MFEFACEKCNEGKEWFSARQIAKELGCTERAVKGALLGDGKRYKTEDALVNMGLVKCRKIDSYGYEITVFSITEKGLEVFRDMRTKGSY